MLMWPAGMGGGLMPPAMMLPPMGMGGPPPGGGGYGYGYGGGYMPAPPAHGPPSGHDLSTMSHDEVATAAAERTRDVVSSIYQRALASALTPHSPMALDASVGARPAAPRAAAAAAGGGAGDTMAAAGAASWPLGASGGLQPASAPGTSRLAHAAGSLPSRTTATAPSTAAASGVGGVSPRTGSARGGTSARLAAAGAASLSTSKH